LFNEKLTFNVSGRYDDNDGYIYGRREHLPGDSANFRTANNWYIELGGDNAFVPMNGSRGFNGITKLTYKITPRMKVSGQVLYDRDRYKLYTTTSGAHAYRFNPEGTYNFREDDYNYSLKLTQAFRRSFYEANFFHSTTDFKQFVFEDPFDPRYVPTTRVVGSPSSAAFEFGGMQMGHVYRKSRSYGGKLDFTSQVTQRHEFKAGISARLDNLQERNFTILYNNQEYKTPTVPPVNGSPSHTFYDRDTRFFSAYAQDKIEYNDMIVNAGVRYDYFDPNSTYFVDLLDPEGPRAKAETKHTVSPRLGISFPITEKGILHFSYGHFYQMPELRRLYTSNLFGAGVAPTVGYANLKPEKTVNYEFGLQQQLGDALALDASVFYKDIRDLLALQSIRYESARLGPSSYNVYLNKDYGAVKGFTLSLNKRYDPDTHLSASIDYTFQQAEGNSVRDGAFFFSALSGIDEEKQIVPLSWDQRHVLNATVMIGEPNNWGLSLIGKVGSGWPHTPNIPNANYVPESNSDRKPWQKNLDLRLFKNLRFAGLDFVLFTKVFNVFDTRNERFVFDDTGRAGYTFVNRSSQETEELKRNYGRPGIHTWSEYQTRPDFYSAPRSVQAGFSLEF
jgi:outer membrane receptor protein involved in Fe transport